MIALTAALVLQVTAQVSFDKNGDPTLTVRAAGRTHVVKRSLDDDNGTPFASEVKLGQTVIRAEVTKLVNPSSGKSVDVAPISRQLYGPTPPEGIDTPLILRSKGVFSLGDSALWLFAWDAWDVSLEPSSYMFALEVRVSADGAPVIARSTNIAGLGPYLHGLRAKRYGQTLAMLGYGVSLFDTASWKESRAHKETGAAIAPSGTLYMQVDHGIQAYPVKGRAYKGSANLGHLSGALRVGGEDVLVFERGLWTPDTRATYRFPGADNGGPPMLLVVPGVGIAVIDRRSYPPEAPGVLLSPKYLQPLAAIRAVR